MVKPTLSPAAEQEIADIATNVLGLQTLEVRNRDCLDFPEVAAWALRRALEAAYLAGMVDHYRKKS